MTDYRWLAESIVMTGAQVTADVLAAIDHAQTIPGRITPAQADRLGQLAAAISAVSR